MNRTHRVHVAVPRCMDKGALYILLIRSRFTSLTTFYEICNVLSGHATLPCLVMFLYSDCITQSCHSPLTDPITNYNKCIIIIVLMHFSNDHTSRRQSTSQKTSLHKEYISIVSLLLVSAHLTSRIKSTVPFISLRHSLTVVVFSCPVYLLVISVHLLKLFM